MRYLLILTGILSGCVMQPPKETFRYTSNSTALVMEELLVSQAEKCWTRNARWEDGIKVSREKNKVFASRFAGDTGIQKPFIIIEINESDKGSTVVVSEGDYACHLTGTCYSENYTASVKQWINGNLACAKEN